jgi:homocysteine S-methyltransferase
MTDLFGLTGKGIIRFDGAIGTVLSERAGRGLLAETLLFSREGTALVRGLHAEYADAGADIITTNTFAANRIVFEREGIVADVETTAHMAVGVAREASCGRCLVAGSVGPLNLGLQRSDYSEDALENIFAEPVRALAGAGADLLKLETFSDTIEALAAIRAALHSSLPVVFLVHGWRSGREQDLVRWEPVLRFAEENGVAAVGCNCAPPADALHTLRMLRNATSLPLAVLPNSGTPMIERGAVTWQEPAEGLPVWYRRFVESGARIVGGCCGTTPGHMRAVYRDADAAGLQPVMEERRVSRTAAGAAVSTARAENPLRSMLASGRPLVSVEIRFGANRSLGSVLDSCAKLPLDLIDMFDTPDNPGAGVNRDTTVAAIVLQERFGILTVPHRATTHVNAIQMQAALLAAWDMGIRGVLAVTGDVPQAGDHQGLATRVPDVKSSVALLRMIASLNEGALINGKPLPEPCDFVPGCAFNPNGTQGPQIAWLKKKAEAGATFVFTQPVFDREGLDRIAEAAAQVPGIRFFAGILPLAGAKQARMLADGRIPGIRVPEGIIGELERYPDTSDQKRAAADLARELALAAIETVGALYLIPPFAADGMETAASIIRAVKRPSGAT